MTLFDFPAPSPDVGAGAPAAPVRRVALAVSYDGTDFHGFAHQPRQRTVGGELAGALEQMAGAPVEIVCAGRTDTGVHATGQVVHADLPAAFVDRPPRRRSAEPGLRWLARSLTSKLGPEIAVAAAAPAPDGFDARHSAIARLYHYHLLNRSTPDPLLARTAWHVAPPLDVNAMRIACDALLGEHDFAAFCRRPAGAPRDATMRRRVHHAAWRPMESPAGIVRFEMEANAFCHQMVRALVGALVAVGEGRINAARIGEILRSGDRAGTPTLAPARGLTLVAVRYRAEMWPFAPGEVPGEPAPAGGAYARA